MTNTLYAFLLSTVAGMSTLIGYFFIYIKNNNIISKCLGFASGVMVTISIIDLIPNSFILISKYKIFIIIASLLAGILISSIIDKKVEKVSKNGLKLYKLGILVMMVIIIHNIPEGIATYITSKTNIKLGIVLALAIALHNIPEGISISIPIYYSTGSKIKSFIYTLISGMSELLGAIISHLFLSKYINNMVLGILYSIIAGMMLNIAINELYSESITYDKRNTVIYFVVGSLVMILNHILFI